MVSLRGVIPASMDTFAGLVMLTRQGVLMLYNNGQER